LSGGRGRYSSWAKGNSKLVFPHPDNCTLILVTHQNDCVCAKVTRKKYPTHNQNLKCQILFSDDYGLPKQKGERFFAPTARTKIQEPNLKQRPRATSKTMGFIKTMWFHRPLVSHRDV
jgi:hypothetical protein